MSPGQILTLFLAFATGLRWWWNLARPLSPEESYLALCGFIPSLAYFDGPGGTPWLVALGISIAGANGLGAVFFWPLLAALASVLSYFLVSGLAGKREGLAIAVLLNLLPVFNSASLQASCAMPLTAATLGTLLCAWRALDDDSAVWWLAAGFCAAGGLLFSYTAWLFLPSLAAVLLFSHRWRRKLAAPAFWIAWIPAIAVYVLFLRWNEQHGWVHFIGGTWRTALALDFGHLGHELVAAACATSPLVLPTLFVAGGIAAMRVRVSPKIKFVLIPGLAALLAATYAALRAWPAQTPGLVAAALALPTLVWLPARIARVPSRPALAIVFVSAAVWSALTLPHPSSLAFIDADIGRQVDSLRAEQTDPAGPPLFVVAENAPLAAALALALPDATASFPGHPPVYTPESAAARSQFDLWPRYDQFVESPQAAPGPDPFTEQQGANPFVGHSALYVTTQNTDELPQSITAAFTSVQLLDEVTAPDGRTLRVFLCSDYQTMPL